MFVSRPSKTGLQAEGVSIPLMTGCNCGSKLPEGYGVTYDTGQFYRW